MTSIFKLSRMTDLEEPEEEISPIFSQVKSHKQENIIPPVGIAKPELIQSFEENLGDEDKIKEAIAEEEAYERETPMQTATREVLAHSARAAEGFFGGINQFLNLLTPELYQNEEGEPYAPGEQPKGLPGANELREITKHFTGKYLEPKRGLTKATQEITGDWGSMFSTPGLNFMQKLILPLGGQTTKQLIKAAGGSEKAQEIGKLGTMMLSSIAGIGNAPRIAGEALREAEQMIPRGLSFTAQPTQKAFQRLKNSNWFKSGKTPSKAPAMAEIERIEAQIANGKINGHMAMQLRRDINEARKRVNAFDLSGPPIDKKAANYYLDQVDNALMASMENYGTRVNPQWLKNYKLANEAFRTTQRSRLISDAIEKFAKPLKSETAKILFHVAGGAAATQFPTFAAAAVPFAGAAKAVQIMNRMIRSPVLRNHYLDVVRAASTGNAAVIQKSLEKFDKAASKLEFKKFEDQSSP